jgi:hypothetical protein
LGSPNHCLALGVASQQTCRGPQAHHDRSFHKTVEALAEDLRSRGRLDVREAFLDGSFAPAKKGDRRSVKRNAAKERRSWLWQIVMAFRFLQLRWRMNRFASHTFLVTSVAEAKA